MDQNERLLMEAIKNAERAVALLKECAAGKLENVNSNKRARTIAEAACSELIHSHSTITAFIKNIPKA
jgi:hypothetical protein